MCGRYSRGQKDLFYVEPLMTDANDSRFTRHPTPGYRTGRPASGNVGVPPRVGRRAQSADDDQRAARQGSVEHLEGDVQIGPHPRAR